MGFVWVEGIAVGDSIDAADYNEIKVNIDTLYAGLGKNFPACAGAAWVGLPVAADDPILTADSQELRDRLDFLQAGDMCGTFNATHHPDNQVGDDDPHCVDNTDNSTHCPSDNPAECPGDNGAECPSFDSVDHTDNPSHEDVYQIGDQGADNPSNQGDFSGFLTTNKGGDNGTYCPTNNQTNYGLNWLAYCETNHVLVEIVVYETYHTGDEEVYNITE